jgi:UDP-2,4-diacetamido-2,4,6-trideoxy-beta-L-altropyranose hydrolase
MSLGLLSIRADASLEIGAGHVLRCMALAQAWRNAGGKAIFLMACSTPFVNERVRGDGFEILTIKATLGSTRDANRTSGYALESQTRWLIVDGYHFGKSYCSSILPAQTNSNLYPPWRVMRIEDAPGYDSDVVDLILNQNVHAENLAYGELPQGAQLLLGPRFTLLRSEFADECGRVRRISPTASRMLITTGGGDPKNILPNMIAAIQRSRHRLEVKVVVGDKSISALENFQELARRGLIELVVGAENMAQLCGWADVAISAAGSTCWEFCAIGLPAIVIDTAENQLPLARSLSQRGIAVHIPFEQASPERIAEELEQLAQSPVRREEMSQRGNNLIDGRGAQRVVSALRAFEIRLRPARNDDCDILWRWANDPGTRNASFRPASIAWDQHREWFEKSLSDDQTLIMIAEDSGNPIATLRMKNEGDGVAQISITLAPEARGKGLAAYLIERGSREAAALMDTRRVEALIKPENIASRRAFENAGYLFIESTRVAEVAAMKYALAIGTHQRDAESVAELANER